MSVQPVDVGAADAVQVRVTRHNDIVPGIQPPGGIRRVPTAVVVEETPELKALYHELGGERRVHGAQKGPVAGRPQRKGRGHATAGVRRLVEKASASRLKVPPTASSRRSADGRQSRSPTRRQRSPKRGQRSPARGRKAQEPGSPRSTGVVAGRDLYVQGGSPTAIGSPADIATQRYVHNLQQQIYFLELETRLLKNKKTRSGATADSGSQAAYQARVPPLGFDGHSSVPSHRTSPRSGFSPRLSPRSGGAGDGANAQAPPPPPPGQAGHGSQARRAGAGHEASRAQVGLVHALDVSGTPLVEADGAVPCSTVSVDSTLLTIHAKYASLERQLRHERAAAAAVASAKDAEIAALKELVKSLREDAAVDRAAYQAQEEQHQANLRAAISQRVESAQLAEALQRRLDETTSKSSQDLSSIEAQQSAAAAEVWRLRAELAESKQAGVAAGDTQQRLADAVAAAESQVDAQRAETARVQAESEARACRVDDVTAELQAAHVQIATLTDELTGVHGERQALKGALDDANKANAELEAKLRSNEAAMEEAARRVDEAVAQRHEATEEQQVLRRKATMRSAEAAETTSLLMEARAEVRRLHGMLAEMQGKAGGDARSADGRGEAGSSSSALPSPGSDHVKLRACIAEAEACRHAVDERDAAIARLQARVVELQDRVVEQSTAAVAAAPPTPMTGIDVSALAELDLEEIMSHNLHVAAAIRSVLEQRAASEPTAVEAAAADQ